LNKKRGKRTILLYFGKRKGEASEILNAFEPPFRRKERGEGKRAARVLFLKKKKKKEKKTRADQKIGGCQLFYHPLFWGGGKKKRGRK